MNNLEPTAPESDVELPALLAKSTRENIEQASWSAWMTHKKWQIAAIW